MCGIAGLIDANLGPADRRQAVGQMCGAMIHRGPDDSGMVSAGPATIGMRRLAIFDPTNGHQPMTSPDGRYHLVFNGAIYNFRTLQIELEGLGWIFRTRCDTEVLLAALVHWGKDALCRLRGMFAFAFWDVAENSLFAARDPLGIKPLYYSLQEGRLLFASEISGLLASGRCGTSVDPAAVSEYLGWLAVPAPRTIYRHVACLLPGEYLTFAHGRLETRLYWTFQSVPGDVPVTANRAEFTSALRHKLEETIRAHVLSDVPVGAFLSGGLDSAIVAGLMSQVSGDTLRTFTIGFEEDGFSEADEAEATARHLRSVHHTRILTGDEVARDINSFIEACDQPTGDGINTYYASQTAQQGGVKVALSGLGGDELFGGYPSFGVVPGISHRIGAWRQLPKPLRSLVNGMMDRGGTRGRKLSDILRNATDAHGVAALQRRVFSDRVGRSMLAPSVAAELSAASPFHPRIEALRAEVGSQDLFALVSAWELRTYMADVLLRDSDVMSMRHSLELRVPFIDLPLIEWLWRQPSQFKDDRRQPKSVLVEAAADLLPPGLLKRKKLGFTFPFPIWMRRDLRPFIEDTLSEESIGRSGLFSVEAVQALWKSFLIGTENREWSRVWSIVVLIAFVNRRAPSVARL